MNATLRYSGVLVATVGVLVAGTTSTYASELNMPPGAPEPPSTVHFVFVGDPPQNLSHTEVQDAVERSADEWNDVTCSRIDVVALDAISGLTDVPADAVPIFFVDLESPCFPNREMGSQSIGFTVWCDAFPSPSILLNAESYSWSTAPVPFQSVDSPDAPPVVDLAGVLTHEMGHAMLMPHLDDPIATMFARYRRDGSQATLAAADDLYFCDLYPGGESECSTNADCSEGTCVGDGTYSACDSFRGAVGDFCSWEQLQCSQECFFSSPQTGTGYCSETCSSDVECPEQMFCRDTSNGSRLCQYDFGEKTPGCATGGSATPTHILAFISLLLILRRRRLR